MAGVLPQKVEDLQEHFLLTAYDESACLRQVKNM